MSLVAYAASSEDESDEDDTESTTTKQNTINNEHISDEDLAPIDGFKNMRTTLSLPVPKTQHQIDDISPLFKRLPAPKPIDKTKTEIVEEDDEFLHKKAIPLEVPTPKKNVVRITIPSLNDFEDLDDKKGKKPNVSAKSSSFSGLMNMLPQPKSEQIFVKAKVSQNADSTEPSKKTMLVPDTVKNRRPAQNTEFVERKVFKKPPSKPKPTTLLVNVSDSEESDEEDFFSLQKDDKLPEVNSEEIFAMVSKKAAEMAKNSSKFSLVAQTNKFEENVQEQIEVSDTVVNSQQQLDNEAIQALLGSQAKRRKMDNLEIIDISSDQVHPNKDEWLRTALASATTYNPTGVLNDDEPAAGTRRKHQITYLAHKAKANEAELQAMWATNRQNRRQTQSKYGF